jgi:multidrug efflux pump subunit AcrA (membrane-fusion protein)
MRSAYLVLLISCFLFVSCKQKPAPPAQPVPVNIFTVKAKKVFYYDKYPATIVALNQVDLRPQVQGVI